MVFICGEFVVANKHLLHDLTEMGMWSPTLENKIIYEDGSALKISEIPEELKVIYKYVFIICFLSSFFPAFFTPFCVHKAMDMTQKQIELKANL